MFMLTVAVLCCTLFIHFFVDAHEEKSRFRSFTQKRLLLLLLHRHYHHVFVLLLIFKYLILIIRYHFQVLMKQYKPSHPSTIDMSSNVLTYKRYTGFGTYSK